ncbi:MAG: hypothetical protein HQL28_05170 [Candidatus Omnitrophica bacterium]|nr:hypothetical protein [Candidatus Omnitrophota bacterium]
MKKKVDNKEIPLKALSERAAKVGIVVLCRYNSKRLPGKVFAGINGKEALRYIVERLKQVKNAEKTVVATSIEKDDDPIADFCVANNIRCFRGSKSNVAERILECAEHFRFDYFVRICGDNVLLDHDLVDEAISIALEDGYDLVSNTKERTFPSGMSVEVLRTDFYKRFFPLFTSDSHREHVTSFFYENDGADSRKFFIYNDICPEAANMKLSLDDRSDLDLLNKIVGRMDRDHTEYHMKDIYGIFLKVRGEN